jgi:hypothetical protein
MSSVFKRARDRKRPGSSWYIAYADEDGIRRTVKGCPDKAATEAMARKLESEADLRRRGIIDPRTDAYAAHEARTLAEHLADWHAYLIGKGSTRQHADLSRNRVARLIELARARRISDLAPSKIQAALKAVRDDARLCVPSITTCVRSRRSPDGSGVMAAPERTRWRTRVYASSMLFAASTLAR